MGTGMGIGCNGARSSFRVPRSAIDSGRVSVRSLRCGRESGRGRGKREGRAVVTGWHVHLAYGLCLRPCERHSTGSVGRWGMARRGARGHARGAAAKAKGESAAAAGSHTVLIFGAKEA